MGQGQHSQLVTPSDNSSGYSNVFAVTFSAVAVTAAQDVFEITATASRPISIRSINIGQYTDFGDAASEILSVLLVTGYTVSGSGGSAATPVALGRTKYSTTVAAEVNNTTVANTGTAVIRHADVWNIAGAYQWEPHPSARILVPASGRFVCRITAPADSITVNGTLIFEEVYT